MYILHCIVLHLILSHLFCRSINKLQIKIKMSNPQALLNNHFPTRVPVNKEIRDFYERSYPQLVPGTLHVAGTCSCRTGFFVMYLPRTGTFSCTPDSPDRT